VSEPSAPVHGGTIPSLAHVFVWCGARVITLRAAEAPAAAAHSDRQSDAPMVIQGIAVSVRVPSVSPFATSQILLHDPGEVVSGRGSIRAATVARPSAVAGHDDAA